MRVKGMKIIYIKHQVGSTSKHQVIRGWNISVSVVNKKQTVTYLSCPTYLPQWCCGPYHKPSKSLQAYLPPCMPHSLYAANIINTIITEELSCSLHPAVAKLQLTISLSAMYLSINKFLFVNG